jgi:putative hydrolase of the HAD superfamily
MELLLNKNSCVVFDLDDTLYDEYDFLLSGFRSVARRFCPEDELNANRLLINTYLKGENAFKVLVNQYQMKRKGVGVNEILELYRNHKPTIRLKDCAFHFISLLKEKKIKTGIITDGRSVTQRNKLEALGIPDKMNLVLISEESGSEKPSKQNYRAFQDRFEANEYIYFGDNPEKDFVAPNLLGWKTICMKDSGKNIHRQHFDWPQEYLPQFLVESFCEIELNVQ